MDDDHETVRFLHANVCVAQPLVMAYVFFVTINLVDNVRSSGERTIECELQWKPFKDLRLSGPQRGIEFVVFVSYEHMARVQAVRRIAKKKDPVFISMYNLLIV